MTLLYREGKALEESNGGWSYEVVVNNERVQLRANTSKMAETILQT